VVRAIDINGRLVQFAWRALATIVFAVLVAITMRLLGPPLERDDGRYAYAGHLILQGVTAYKVLAPQFTKLTEISLPRRKGCDIGKALNN
jgi:hypothetical protein